jgi:hypothetical protein
MQLAAFYENHRISCPPQRTVLMHPGPLLEKQGHSSNTKLGIAIASVLPVYLMFLTLLVVAVDRRSRRDSESKSKARLRYKDRN